MRELFALLSDYHSSLASQAELAVLVFLRIGAAMATLPALGETSIPVRVRLVLTIMLAAAILPAVHPVVTSVPLVSGFAPEVATGLLLGLLVRLFILSLMTAGSIAANAISLSQLFPSAADAQPAVSKLLVVAGLAIAMHSDFALRVLDYLVLSYSLLPPGRWPTPSLLAEWGVGRIAHAFSAAFMISMPFVIASLLYNIALGFINRAMPQLMVTFVGAPALSLGGLILLALVVPVALVVWVQGLNDFLSLPTAPLK